MRMPVELMTLALLLMLLFTHNTHSRHSSNSPSASTIVGEPNIRAAERSPFQWWREPPPAFGGLEVFMSAALTKQGDRWDVAKRAAGAITSPPTMAASSIRCLSGTAYLVSDLCAMGHLTKDAAMLASWLIDHTDEARAVPPAAPATSSLSSSTVHEAIGPRHIDPRSLPPLSTIIFSNQCMQRRLEGSTKIDKRTPLFHGVLQHWFLAVLTDARLNDTRAAAHPEKGVTLEALSPLVESMPTVRFQTRPTHHRASNLAPPPPVKVMLAEDLDELRRSAAVGQQPPPLCFDAVVKRGPERWRWFRSRAHANEFRQRMWHYFGLRPAMSLLGASDSAKLPHKGAGRVGGTMTATRPPRSRCVLGVTVLQRDEDRHFDEVRVAAMLAAAFGGTGGGDDGRHHNSSSSSSSSSGRLFGVRNSAPAAVSAFDGSAAASVVPPHCAVRVTLHKFDKIHGSSAPPPPHPEQLRILAEDTDVLVAAHGAGLASIAVMRRGSAVIELFPHNFRYSMYSELAALAQLHYVPFESPVVHPPRCCSARGGDDTPALSKPHDGNGVGARACKKCDILIADDELFSLVADALGRVLLHRAAAAVAAEHTKHGTN